MIVANQLWLSCVKAEKVACIERLRDPTAFALTTNARSIRAEARIHLCDVAHRQLMLVEELIKKTEAAGRDPEREPISRMLEVAWPPPWVEEIPEDAERDEYEAMREGLCDLVPCSTTSSERGRGASALFAHSWRSNWRSNDRGLSPYLSPRRSHCSFVQKPATLT